MIEDSASRESNMKEDDEEAQSRACWASKSLVRKNESLLQEVDRLSFHSAKK